ncbi:alpha/beta hydrolase-fold protein [uncultured Boseongicola sp.]|uniref:esterase family protein n=1 Tax=uncultured Boseongicola sp. TaxID=1648499 RepID=UPI00260880B0|nr:alpha/beta hydrolase-fold protein [uncultured Boseongicola sp.]
MTKKVSRWRSDRLHREIALARWGDFGQPVLLFPTAGGDAEEIDRMQVIRVLGPLLAEGRIKIYSCDSIAGAAFASKEGSIEHRCWLLNQFHEYVAHEVVPAIRADCNDENIEILAAGASIGAFNAVAVTCRYPHLFHTALGMSGTYDLESLLDFQGNSEYYFASPLAFLPHLEGPILKTLQSRFIALPFGQGRWENPAESWRIGELLGEKAIPNRVDAWGEQYDHDWPTWREMLPLYLDDLVS